MRNSIINATKKHVKYSSFDFNSRHCVLEHTSKWTLITHKCEEGEQHGILFALSLSCTSYRAQAIYRAKRSTQLQRPSTQKDNVEAVSFLWTRESSIRPQILINTVLTITISEIESIGKFHYQMLVDFGQYVVDMQPIHWMKYSQILYDLKNVLVFLLM